MFIPHCKIYEGFPGNSGLKIPPAIAGDVGSITGSGRSHAEGNAKPIPIFLSRILQAIQFMGL